MSSAEKVRAAETVPPRAGQPRRLVHMAVEGEQGLPLLDESLDGDRADVHVKRHVVHHLAVEGRAIEDGPVGRGVQQENRPI